MLYDQAMLAEGGDLDDPAIFVRRVNKLIVDGLAARAQNYPELKYAEPRWASKVRGGVASDGAASRLPAARCLFRRGDRRASSAWRRP